MASLMPTPWEAAYSSCSRLSYSLLCHGRSISVSSIDFSVAARIASLVFLRF
jgi:hypothetical protein